MRPTHRGSGHSARLHGCLRSAGWARAGASSTDRRTRAPHRLRRGGLRSSPQASCRKERLVRPPTAAPPSPVARRSRRPPASADRLPLPIARRGAAPAWRAPVDPASFLLRSTAGRLRLRLAARRRPARRLGTARRPPRPRSERHRAKPLRSTLSRCSSRRARAPKSVVFCSTGSFFPLRCAACARLASSTDEVDALLAALMTAVEVLDGASTLGTGVIVSIARSSNGSAQPGGASRCSSCASVWPFVCAEGRASTTGALTAAASLGASGAATRLASLSQVARPGVASCFSRRHRPPRQGPSTRRR